jgi:acetolactate synthase-1/3 small subunit
MKVRADADRRSEIMKLAEVFNARIVDVGPTTLVLECVEHSDRLAALEELLAPYGILEAIRTGRVAMGRASAPEGESRARLRVTG